MATNVPPAPGVTPWEAAKRLRILLKKRCQNGGGNATVRMWAKESSRAQVRINQYLDTIDEKIGSLHNIAKRRRPEETRIQAASLKAQMAAMRAEIQRQRACERSILETVGAADTKKDDLEAYALIQVIPTMEGAPTSNAENSLRAITAIVKAHHGLLMEGPVAIPSPEIPIVLVESHAVEKIVEKIVEVEKPVVMANGVVYKLPFRVCSNVTPGGYTSSIPKHTTIQYGAVEDGVGDISNWDGGNCNLEEAMEAFRCFCNAYYNPKGGGGGYRLEDAGGTVIGERPVDSDPIAWNVKNLISV